MQTRVPEWLENMLVALGSIAVTLLFCEMAWSLYELLLDLKDMLWI